MCVCVSACVCESDALFCFAPLGLITVRFCLLLAIIKLTILLCYVCVCVCNFFLNDSKVAKSISPLNR